MREIVKIRRGIWEANSKPLGAGFLMFGGRNSVNSSRNNIHNASDIVPGKKMGVVSISRTILKASA